MYSRHDRPDTPRLVAEMSEFVRVVAPEVAVALVECTSMLLSALSLRLHNLSMLADQGARQARAFSNARGVRPTPAAELTIERSA